MQLFVYGVLLGELASPAIRDILRGLGPGRPATARGLLYAIREPAGCCPAMVPGRGIVRGVLHEASRVDFKMLDLFENCYPDSPERSEFLRRGLIVRAAGRSGIAAQAYVYNRPLTGRLVRIGHGDFARWLRESGGRPYAG